MTVAWHTTGTPLLGDADVALAHVLERRWPGADPLALLGAALASHAVQQGHSCLDLERLASDATLREMLEADARVGPLDVAALDAALRAAPFVSVQAPDASAESAAPLVLDGTRLYLRRYHGYEREAAASLRARAAAPSSAIDNARAKRRIAELFPGAASARQAEASLLALRERLVVLCGGPGTGKTYTIVRLLALLADLARGAPLRMALAAPTGKAAARLIASVRAGLDAIDADGALAQRLPAHATTLHRLLGVRPDRVAPKHDADNPLELDVLVLDESSMVDLPLFAKLLRALPPACKLVLVGDPEQLPAVEGGAVLYALAGRGTTWFGRTGSVGDRVVELTATHRFGARSGIGLLVDAVRGGNADDVRALLADGRGDLVWHDAVPAERRDAFAADVAAGYGALRTARDPAAALAALERFRVLCALRDGSAGVAGLNAHVEAALGVRASARAMYAGRPLLIGANDAALGLYNGDTGIVLPDAHQTEPRAWFADTGAAPRSLLPSRLPAHETAYAMTVHKAQGSEFDDVVLVLPRNPHALLTREWLYTAVSRARRKLTIYGRFDVIAEALARRQQVMSGLGARL